MPRGKLLDMVAPCGLNCGKCVAYEGSKIRDCSKTLEEQLGPNFTSYAERFKHMEGAFKHYSKFKELLAFLAKGECKGCRHGGCLFKECRVPHCGKRHGVDFCYECAEFPCDRHGFSPRLENLWRRNNELLREMGLEAYYEMIKDKPRYP